MDSYNNFLSKTTRIINWRFFTIAIFFIFAFVLLVARVTWLHLFFKPPEKDFLRNSQDERGVIYDSLGNALAVSQEELSIGINADRLKNKEKITKILLQTSNLDIDSNNISEILQKTGFQYIKRKAPRKLYQDLLAINDPGLIIQKEYKRYYPEGPLFSHVIGFVDIDNIGREGIERTFDNYLSGRYIPIPGQSPLSSYFNYSISDISIHLTVNQIAQYILNRQLQIAFEEHQANATFGIIMEVDSGRIIAMSSLPDFDPNKIQKSRPLNRRNRPIIDTYEPGSTFKIFIAAALLEENLVDDDEVFFCPGFIKKGDHTFRCHAKHGRIKFSSALKKSCNIAMIEAIAKISPQKLYQYLSAFGFGAKTGMSLSGEESGLLRHPNEWSHLSPYAISIGYEVAVTGIQLVRAVAALGNHGILVKPKIVNHIEGIEDPYLDKFQIEPIRQVVSAKTAQRLLEQMHQVVLSDGTGALAAPFRIQAAGKTGTAQKSKPNQGYVEGYFVASFVGLLPYPDPKYAILIVIDEPQGDYWGGKIASPIFKNISDQLAHHLNLLPYIRFADVADIKIEAKPNNDLLLESNLPNFKNLSKREVVVLLENLHRLYGINYAIEGYGYVSDQQPAPGTPYLTIRNNQNSIMVKLND